MFSLRCQFVEKVCIYKNRANSLIPLRTPKGFASLQSLWAFYLGILAESPNPFPVVKGCVCSVGFASLQSPWAYTPGIRAGLSVGLPPSPCLGLRSKQGRFGCLPKVLHDAKPSEQATPNTHFQKNYIGLSTVCHRSVFTAVFLRLRLHCRGSYGKM